MDNSFEMACLNFCFTYAIRLDLLLTFFGFENSFEDICLVFFLTILF
jgi:hypothetical protein